MCMKLALLASTVHLSLINITKHILFTLKHDATLMRCPVSENKIEHANNERYSLAWRADRVTFSH